MLSIIKYDLVAIKMQGLRILGHNDYVPVYRLNGTYVRTICAPDKHFD